MLKMPKFHVGDKVFATYDSLKTPGRVVRVIGHAALRGVQYSILWEGEDTCDMEWEWNLELYPRFFQALEEIVDGD